MMKMRIIRPLRLPIYFEKIGGIISRMIVDGGKLGLGMF